MKLTRFVLFVALLGLSAMGATALAQEEGDAEAAAEREPATAGDIAEQAFRIRERYCYKCHITDSGAPKFDVLDSAALLGRDGGPAYVVAGNPSESLLWQRMIDPDAPMPPLDQPERPTEEELATIQEWIQQGAPEFKPGSARERISEEDLLRSILTDLQSFDEREDRKHQRYFSLVHLHNNVDVNDEKLRLYRAALAIAVNSLNRRSSRIVDPVPVNESRTVFRIDLRDVGWDKVDQQTVKVNDKDVTQRTVRWGEVLKAYPYGMKWRDATLATLQEDIEEAQKSNSVVPAKFAYIRADWFVTKATRPPLYHVLLGLPDTLTKLDAELGVDLQSDFLAGRVQRAGFTGSGVSKHNRAVDRLEGSNTAYYYRSYDFGGSSGKKILFRFPLGPTFDRNPFKENPDLAFSEDGGEFVISMPNGLQMYYICDGKGNRLNDAPVSIVRDLSEIAGTPAVTNGISCIGCHRRGIQPYKDQVRDAQVVLGNRKADTTLRQLYVTAKQMDDKIAEDTARFMTAWQKCVAPYRDPDLSGDATDIIDLNEPVTAIAKFYDRELGLEEVARELVNIEDPQDVASAIRTNRQLQQLGLGPLARGGRVIREMWDATDESSFSVYQQAAEVLGLGDPDRVSN
jgi:hypothetical protein